MENRLYDSELKLLEIIWEKAPVSARYISLEASEKIGWNKNTTYTILVKLVAKGYIARSDPGFVCTPLISRSEVQQMESQTLLSKLYNGSKRAFFASFIDGKKLTKEESEELLRLIDKNGD